MFMTFCGWRETLDSSSAGGPYDQPLPKGSDAVDRSRIELEDKACLLQLQGYRQQRLDRLHCNCMSSLVGASTTSLQHVMPMLQARSSGHQPRMVTTIPARYSPSQAGGQWMPLRVRGNLK